jgi:hypothetical protein
MLSLIDLFAFLHQSDPQTLRLVGDEIARDLRQRQSIGAFQENAQSSDRESSLIRGE